MDLEKRVRMAAESILENEALCEGLDEEGAKALLDWGVVLAGRIVRATAPLEDDEEAQEASYPRMRALRGMLRSVADLLAGVSDETQRAELIQEITAQLSIIYGPAVPVLEISAWNIFAAGQSTGTGQRINALRARIEENDPNLPEGGA